MGKEIHILLSRKSWEELDALKKGLNLPDCIKSKEELEEPKTYEEYLAKEKINPTLAWCA